MAKAPVFDQTYQQYVDKLAALDLPAMATALGLNCLDDGVAVRLFNSDYRITAQGIAGPQGTVPDLGVSVLIANYLLRCPEQQPEAGPLCAYKDFRDAAPLIHYFTTNAENALSGIFGGHADQLVEKCMKRGGEPYAADLSYDVKFRFQGLPQIPLYLLFNDVEDGFPADCKILFNKSAESYLDMESLAILGVMLTQILVK